MSHATTDVDLAEHITYLRVQADRHERQLRMSRPIADRAYTLRAILDLAAAEGRACGLLFRLRELRIGG